MINHGTDRCISFGGLKADQMVTTELLRRLQPLGIQAALEAIDRQSHRGDERLAQRELALEQARFEVTRARRQYDAVDPDHRLVASELERRWNEALRRQDELEQELQALRAAEFAQLSDATREALIRLGEDLPALWNHPQCTQQLKKRIVRTVVQEIVAKREDDRISMVLHWRGGDHTVLEFVRARTGQHRWACPEDLPPLVRDLARVLPDLGIAATLNRLGRRTPRGHTWTESRVRSLRANHEIAVYQEGERLARGEMTLTEAAEALGMSTQSVRRLIDRKQLPATQTCTGSPWVILRTDLDRLISRGVSDGPQPENSEQISFELQ